VELEAKTEKEGRKAEENNKLNSLASVRERIMPIERPPLVGEVSANFCG
jgi:hypothetical protein